MVQRRPRRLVGINSTTNGANSESSSPKPIVSGRVEESADSHSSVAYKLATYHVTNLTFQGNPL